MCAVKTGKAQREQMFSAIPPRADIAQQSRHVRFVPEGDLRCPLQTLIDFLTQQPEVDAKDSFGKSYTLA